MLFALGRTLFLILTSPIVETFLDSQGAFTMNNTKIYKPKLQTYHD